MSAQGRDHHFRCRKLVAAVQLSYCSLA
jgi:hypothetical protein